MSVIKRVDVRNNMDSTSTSTKHGFALSSNGSSFVNFLATIDTIEHCVRACAIEKQDLREGSRLELYTRRSRITICNYSAETSVETKQTRHLQSIIQIFNLCTHTLYFLSWSSGRVPCSWVRISPRKGNSRVFGPQGRRSQWCWKRHPLLATCQEKPVMVLLSWS